jgi:hypothetical protein
VVVVYAGKVWMMAKGIVQVHGAAAGKGEDVLNSTLHEKICNVVRYFYFHDDAEEKTI